jgi:MFS family permease
MKCGVSGLNLGFMTEGTKIGARKLFAITIISSGTFSWFFLLGNNIELLFQSFTNSHYWIYIGEALFYFFAAFSAIIGSGLSPKFNRKKLLQVWIASGLLVTGLIIIFQGINIVLLFGPLLGISLGLGFPFALSLLADCTIAEERGRVSGILMLQTFIMLSLALVIENFLKLGLIGIVLLLVILRSTSFLGLSIEEDACTDNLVKSKIRKSKSWFQILRYRSFILYFFPWLIFIVAVVLTDQILWANLLPDPNYRIVFSIGLPLLYGETALFGFVSGILADRFGRKPLIISGLAILGVSFAFVGFAPSPLSVFINLVTRGIAFGFLMVVYIAVPGDLAFSYSKEKFYALILVLPMTVYSLGSVPLALGRSAPASVLSPILSIILFLSAYAVFLAPETLSQSKIREREIKEHVRKVRGLLEESQNQDNSLDVD